MAKRNVARTVVREDEYGLTYLVYGSLEGLTISNGESKVWIGLDEVVTFLDDVKKVYQAVQGGKR